MVRFSRFSEGMTTKQMGGYVEKAVEGLEDFSYQKHPGVSGIGVMQSGLRALETDQDLKYNVLETKTQEMFEGSDYIVYSLQDESLTGRSSQVFIPDNREDLDQLFITHQTPVFDHDEEEYMAELEDYLINSIEARL